MRSDGLVKCGNAKVKYGAVMRRFRLVGKCDGTAGRSSALAKIAIGAVVFHVEHHRVSTPLSNSFLALARISSSQA